MRISLITLLVFLSLTASGQQLKESLKSLKGGCLDFADLYSSMQKCQQSTTPFIDRKREPWIYGQDKRDSAQFARADLLRPCCKLFENDKILAIVFQDIYDYKQALHVINFQKPGLQPVSSFILFSIGGDAEDFWNTTCKQVSATTYKQVEEFGRYNAIPSRDTTFIKQRTTFVVEIDKQTGKLERRDVKTERGLIELK